MIQCSNHFLMFDWQNDYASGKRTECYHILDLPVSLGPVPWLVLWLLWSVSPVRKFGQQGQNCHVTPTARCYSRVLSMCRLMGDHSLSEQVSGPSCCVISLPTHHLLVVTLVGVVISDFLCQVFRLYHAFVAPLSWTQIVFYPCPGSQSLNWNLCSSPKLFYSQNLNCIFVLC